ncbi:MAG: DNA polymerase III subunit beta [Candidatus Babeliaceae bacterium]|jgi:DNA polymerase-3 subunit beta
MEKKFYIEQKSLLGLLASMQPICAKRTTLDATTYILFHIGHRELILKSTDLEISLQANCSLENSTLTEPESFLVGGKRIFDIVKELDGIIECTLNNNQLLLRSGAVALDLNIKDDSEFPPFPERIENIMDLNALQLKNMLDSVAFLIPSNNTNPALNALLMEIAPSVLTMTTTDGHCLAQARLNQDTVTQNQQWLLPKRAIFELKKILESANDSVVFLGTCGRQLVFSGDFFNFFTKLVSDPFPQYASILDKTSFIPATIDKTQFTKTLRRSTCLLSGNFLATNFGFSHNALRVSINNKEVGKLDEEIPMIGFDTEPLTMRFYAPYLLNGIQAFNQEKITFFLKNGTKPIIFESSADAISLTYIVMPVSSQTT